LEEQVSETASSTRITSVGRVMVPVADQDRAIEFYTGKLHFELRADIPYGDGERWVEVGPPGAETSIALVTPRDAFQPGTVNNIALATRDIDAVHAELSEAGADVDAEVSRMGGPVPPMLWFRDQDGNPLLVVEDSGQR
jgi:catechol 2,3-dioxygenase-like lactoylglutathione lyase family enzyme